MPQAHCLGFLENVGWLLISTQSAMQGGTLLSDGPVSRGQRSFAPVEAGFGKFLLEWSIELFEQFLSLLI